MCRSWRLAILGAVATALVAAVSVDFWHGRGIALETPPLRAFSLDSRPQADRYLFDYAGNLKHYEEGAHRFLHRMSERFHIEAIIVTLPAVPAQKELSELAVDMVNRWRVGGEFEGRGLLLLLVEQDSQVKLEVTYDLEDVFTDAFTGYVADLQLRPYFLAGDIGTGLVAVMEQLERRAQLKQQSEYTPGVIARTDDELLAGGAGTRRNLERYERDRATAAAASDGPGAGARSPEEGWTVMLTKWAGKGSGIDLDIYTEMTKLAMGDPDDADPRTLNALPHWLNADYQVRQNRNHAVIWFGNIEGWNNAPFLFCRTPTGWKFDIVHQRRLVVMRENPDWVIEQGDYPYLGLLSDAPRSTGKDLPLPTTDHYRCQNDAEFARQIRKLEKASVESPGDVDVLMSLLRLNVITGRRPTHVTPLIQQLRALAPKNPDLYKYAAIYNVNSFFQYKTALREIQTHNELRPDDVFGHNFVGFLYYRLGDYEASAESLERAIELGADNVYAYSLLARVHALLYRQTKSNSSRRRHRERSLTMLQMAANSATPDTTRVEYLRVVGSPTPLNSYGSRETYSRLIPWSQQPFRHDEFRCDS